MSHDGQQLVNRVRANLRKLDDLIDEAERESAMLEELLEQSRPPAATERPADSSPHTLQLSPRETVAATSPQLIPEDQLRMLYALRAHGFTLDQIARFSRHNAAAIHAAWQRRDDADDRRAA